MFAGVLGSSITKRAIENKILSVTTTNIRDYAYSKHQQVDDTAYGGGAGMVMKVEPIYYAIEAAKQKAAPEVKPKVIVMCPTGATFSQAKAKKLAEEEHLILLCGHYEGFDHRITENLVDEAISLGDYVLTGGELAAMVVVDAVSRMVKGVLGSQESAETDSFYQGLLEYPQYTKPREFMGMKVPDVLVSGNHAHIAKWRREQALKITWEKRPDLLEQTKLSPEDKKFLAELKKSAEDK